MFSCYNDPIGIQGLKRVNLEAFSAVVVRQWLRLQLMQQTQLGRGTWQPALGAMPASIQATADDGLEPLNTSTSTAMQLTTPSDACILPLAARPVHCTATPAVTALDAIHPKLAQNDAQPVSCL